MRNEQHRLCYLKTFALVGGIVWRYFEGADLLEDVNDWEFVIVFCFLLTLPASCFRLKTLLSFCFFDLLFLILCAYVCVLTCIYAHLPMSLCTYVHVCVEAQG